MASSLAAGERKWASARRGGMTVLGKVAVPKPINLPSQKSENHGLDPNVEIVPKGTITWGASGPSARPANVWGTSASSSPAATDGSASILHLSAHPSDGEGGTRPSTAGSDKSHEPTYNAWSSGSRPSSASGLLAPGNAPQSLGRPRSADTRPGSSQLSRFAEAPPEGLAAWKGLGGPDKLGTSNPDRFNLSSGDFPTLGTEKAAEPYGEQGHSSNVRPVSASGRPSSHKGFTSTAGDYSGSSHEGGIMTALRGDDSLDRRGESAHADKWQRQPPSQHYPHTGIPQQTFDSWHVPQAPNQPEGAWFRGGPHMGPYRPMGGPGGYAMDPSAYFHSQMPMRPMAYPQPGPRPGVGPSGYSGNGELQRPLMQDPLMLPGHPVMPVSPGRYSGPFPYNGYYRPPGGFHKPDDPNGTASVVGVAPGVYDNRFHGPTTNLDPTISPARPSTHNAVNTNPPKDHVDQVKDSNPGPYKVFLKQRGDDLPEKIAQNKQSQVERSSEKLSVKSPTHAMDHNDWDSVAENDEPMDFSKPAFAEQSSSKPSQVQGKTPAVTADRADKNAKVGAWHSNSAIKLDSSAKHDERPQSSPVSETSTVSVAKTRHDRLGPRSLQNQNAGPILSFKEENSRKFQSSNTREHLLVKDVPTVVVSRKDAVALHDKSVESFDKISDKIDSVRVERDTHSRVKDSAAHQFDSSETIERPRSQGYKRGHVTGGRSDFRNKGRYDVQEVDGWKRKVSTTEPPAVNPILKTEAPDFTVQENKDDQEKQSHVTSLPGSEPYVMPSGDAGDYKNQRARMREIAAQRAKQRQEEEEERIREQKAKALAKLEELNRRTLSDNAAREEDQTPEESIPLPNEPEAASYIPVFPVTKGGSDRMPIFPTNTIEDIPLTFGTIGVNLVAETMPRAPALIVHADDPSNVAASAPLDAPQRSEAPHSTPVVSVEFNPGPVSEGNVAKTNENIPRQRPTGNRKKQNLAQDKGLNNQQVPVTESIMEGNVASDANSSIKIPSSSVNTEATGPHKKKNNRNSRNKPHKFDEASVVPTVTASPIEGAESADPKSQEPLLKSEAPRSVPATLPLLGSEAKVSAEVVKPENQGPSQVSDDGHHGRVNQFKNHHSSRKAGKGSHIGRAGDKSQTNEAVWAPVKSHNQNLSSDDGKHDNQGTEVESSKKNVVVGMQSPVKNKRAEMERYVPKPVAKEQAQQMTAQQPLSSQHESDVSVKLDRAQKQEAPEQCDHNDGKNVVAVEVKNHDSKQKHGKPHPSWRQRGSGESYRAVNTPQEASTTTGSGSLTKTNSDVSKYPGSSGTETSKCSDGILDGAPPTTQGSGPRKDHGQAMEPFVGSTGERGRKVHQRVGWGSGNDSDAAEQKALPEKDENNIWPKIAESDGKKVSMDDQQSGPENTVSQWQPKQQAYENRQGNSGNGRGGRSQKFSGHVTDTEKEVSSQGRYHRRGEKDYGGPHKSNQQPLDLHANPNNFHYHDEKRTGRFRDNVPPVKEENQPAMAAVSEQPRPMNEAPEERANSSSNRRHGQSSYRHHNRSHEASYDSNWVQGQDNEQPRSMNEAPEERPNSSNNRRHGQSTYRHQNRSHEASYDSNWVQGQDNEQARARNGSAEERPNSSGNRRHGQSGYSHHNRSHEASYDPNWVQRQENEPSRAVNGSSEERPNSSGNRMHGKSSYRHHNRAHESSYDPNWVQGQENGRQHAPGNGDRRKHHLHFEYVRGGNQPNDPFQHNSSHEEAHGNVNQNPVTRYHDRGNNHGRRPGRFYGRGHSPAVKVAAGAGEGD